jgi:hypothetical protein
MVLDDVVNFFPLRQQVLITDDAGMLMERYHMPGWSARNFEGFDEVVARDKVEVWSGWKRIEAKVLDRIIVSLRLGAGRTIRNIGKRGRPMRGRHLSIVRRTCAGE